MKPFTEKQLDKLRAQYESVEGVNPEGAVFQSLRGFVAALPDDMQTQLAEANIRWLSYLARRGLRKTGENQT